MLKYLLLLVTIFKYHLQRIITHLSVCAIWYLGKIVVKSNLFLRSGCYGIEASELSPSKGALRFFKVFPWVKPLVWIWIYFFKKTENYITVHSWGLLPLLLNSKFPKLEYSTKYTFYKIPFYKIFASSFFCFEFALFG